MMTFGLDAGQQDEVWAWWRQGESQRMISRRMGINLPSTVRAFLASTGGVRRRPRHRNGQQLTAAERGRDQSWSGGRTGVSGHRSTSWPVASTISRELSRNGGPDCYRARVADVAADRRAERPKRCRLAEHDRLREVVERGLGEGWSPQQIAARLIMDYPDDETMRVSHETIYLTLFVQARGGLRPGSAGRCGPGGRCDTAREAGPDRAWAAGRHRVDQ